MKMLSEDQNNPNLNSAPGHSTAPETATTSGTTANNFLSGIGSRTTGRTLLDNLNTRTSTMAMPGELHPQAGTHPASMSTGDYSTHPSGQPTSNPGTATGKSNAAAASPFAIGAGLTGTAPTGGTTNKRGNHLFGVRSSKEVLRTTPAGQPTTTELWRMDGLRA